MRVQVSTVAGVALQACSGATLYDEPGVRRDLDFLRAWEDGQYPELCHNLRVRQIYRGNPVLVAQRLSQKVDVQKTRPSL
jgi:hypothetical protein